MNISLQLFKVLLYVHGLYSCRISTAVLSLSLFLICTGHKLLVEKMKMLLLLVSPTLAGVAVTALGTTLPLVEDYRTNPMQAFGESQEYVSLGVLGVSLVVTLVCLIMKQR